MRMVALIGRISTALAAVAMAQVVVLMGLMVYEVICRFALNSPNIWSYDVAYMLSGTLFLLGAGYTLRENSHVRIDFIAQALPLSLRWGFERAFHILVFLPILGTITWSVAWKAWVAFLSGQTDYTSPWAPVMWPFYAGLAIGLLGLWLQVVALVLQGRSALADTRAGA